MAKPLLIVNNLSKAFGGVVATDNVDFVAELGELHAIIGPNGAGKTTLIAQLSGEMIADSGQIFFENTDITLLPNYRRSLLGIARSFQITSLMLDMNVIDNVALAIQSHKGHSYRFWTDARNDRDLTLPALDALKTVRLEERAFDKVNELSHGEHRQLEIAVALATQPKLILLDEPMAGMGALEGENIINILRQLKSQKTMVLIEHDMNAVFALADRITVMVYGQVIATGSPEEIRNNKDVREAYLGTEETPIC
ncbi:MAG: ABC transporter ATP-binding protein [Rhodospirillaceae bacterium]|nr:ABC transporter ATP-binding protein [Rhodospirillaceae bacterium]